MLKISNLTKPSNKKWKLVADILLFTLPAYSLAIVELPIPEVSKVWINFTISSIVIAIKAISKFTAEADQTDDNTGINQEVS
jgi:hypothetical protein